MKVRCPHCREVFTPHAKNRCPHCDKTVLLPGFFGTSGRVTARKIADRSRQRGQRATAPKLPFLGRAGLLIVVLVLLAIAGGLLLRQVRVRPPSTEGYTRRLARENMQTLRTALEQLRTDGGRYPTAREGLAALVHNPGLEGWQGPYIFELKPDPWGCTFHYTNTADGILIQSFGPDGVAGSADDIRLAGNDGNPRSDRELYRVTLPNVAE